MKLHDLRQHTVVYCRKPEFLNPPVGHRWVCTCGRVWEKATVGWRVVDHVGHP